MTCTTLLSRQELAPFLSAMLAAAAADDTCGVDRSALIDRLLDANDPRHQLLRVVPALLAVPLRLEVRPQYEVAVQRMHGGYLSAGLVGEAMDQRMGARSRLYPPHPYPDYVPSRRGHNRARRLYAIALAAIALRGRPLATLPIASGVVAEHRQELPILRAWLAQAELNACGLTSADDRDSWKVLAAALTDLADYQRWQAVDRGLEKYAWNLQVRSGFVSRYQTPWRPCGLDRDALAVLRRGRGRSHRVVEGQLLLWHADSAASTTLPESRERAQQTVAALAGQVPDYDQSARTLLLASVPGVQSVWRRSRLLNYMHDLVEAYRALTPWDAMQVLYDLQRPRRP